MKKSYSEIQSVVVNKSCLSLSCIINAAFISESTLTKILQSITLRG